MKQDPPSPPIERRTQCGTCSLVALRFVQPTLSPTVMYGPCGRCGKSTMQRDLGEPLPEEVVHPTPPEPSLELAVPEVSAVDGPPMLAGDPELCPECQEVGVHDADCPFPGKLHQAYLRWRATEDGQTVVADIRRRALELRARGFRHYGIQAIAEVARFDHALRVGPDVAGYKINNSYLSRLARDLMREPELEGLFETRELTSVR